VHGILNNMPPPSPIERWTVTLRALVDGIDAKGIPPRKSLFSSRRLRLDGCPPYHHADLEHLEQLLSELERLADRFFSPPGGYTHAHLLLLEHAVKPVVGDASLHLTDVMEALYRFMDKVVESYGATCCCWITRTRTRTRW
jgi:hypothetical protein